MSIVEQSASVHLGKSVLHTVPSVILLLLRVTTSVMTTRSRSSVNGVIPVSLSDSEDDRSSEVRGRMNVAFSLLRLRVVFS